MNSVAHIVDIDETNAQQQETIASQQATIASQKDIITETHKKLNELQLNGTKFQIEVWNQIKKIPKGTGDAVKKASNLLKKLAEAKPRTPPPSKERTYFVIKLIIVF